METTLLWPEKPPPPSPSSQNRVIRELLHGRDLAVQLQTLLSKNDGDGSKSVGEIAGEILRTFTESISALSSGEVGDDGGSDDSISSKKRSASKDGRGSYKRRKSTETWVAVAPTVDDSFSWRKYGQKEILHAKFPRCYFRCSHKPDRGCSATKQVQQMADDSKMFHITYIGHHTCKKPLKSPKIISDSDPWESYAPQMNHQQTHLPVIKQELNKEDTMSLCPMMFGDDMSDLIDFVGFEGEFSLDEAAVFSYNDDFL